MTIAVVTDSTSYLPKEIIEKYGIYTIPLSVIFGDESFREEIDISTPDFYKRVADADELPTTSQPAIGSFVELFEQLADKYEHVISIHLSKKLSGTYEAARSAGRMVDGIQVHSYDSGLSATPLGFFAIRAAELAQSGTSVDNILSQLDDMKKNTRAYFMVDDLKHLQRGGRLSSAQALLGSVLNIKPILHLVDGTITPFEKIRTRRRAINRIMGMLEEDAREKKVKRVVFIHANNEQAAIDLKNTFSEKHSHIESIVSYFGPVIGTYLGEGALGVSWYTT